MHKDAAKWGDDVRREIFNEIFSHLKEIITESIANEEESPFLEDIVYGYNSGKSSFSLIEENRKFNAKLKNLSDNAKISSNDLQLDNVENQSIDIFETTKDNWKYFNYFNPELISHDTITLRQQWVVCSEKDAKGKDIKDINNIKQEFIFNSEDDAAKWIGRESKTFMRKKIEFYFPGNGNEPITVWMDSDEEARYYVLSTMVKLDYTYIHKSLAQELERKYNTPSDRPFWNEINTSGLYTIYGYRSSSTNKYLYYKSYNEAYSSYSKDSSLTTDVVETRENIYYYQYIKIDDDGKKIWVVSIIMIFNRLKNVQTKYTKLSRKMRNTLKTNNLVLKRREYFPKNRRVMFYKLWNSI